MLQWIIVSYRYNFDLYHRFKFRVVLTYDYVTKRKIMKIVKNSIRYGLYCILLTALFSQDVYEGYTLFTPGGGGGGGSATTYLKDNN